MTVPEAWQMLLNVEPRLRKKLGKLVGWDKVDDVWTEVILEKAPRLAATYDASKGPAESYFINSLFLYAFKWKCINGRKPRQRAIDERDAERCIEDNGLEVSLILSELSDFDRWLLVMKDMEGFTFKEIGEHIGVTPTTVGRWYTEAIANAREAVKRTAGSKGRGGLSERLPGQPEPGPECERPAGSTPAAPSLSLDD